MKRRPIEVLLLLVGIACGSSQSGVKNEPARPAPAASAETRPATLPGHISRRDVMGALSGGLGSFLTRLQLEPLLMGGKFKGWRIVKLREGDPLWAHVDLAPGDVVTSVNDRPLERPEQALGAFQSLAIAKELRVKYERNGAPREIVYPIDDEPAAP